MNVVITGTSRGIGLKLAEIALEGGHRVLCIARKVDGELSRILARHADRARVLAADVSADDIGEDILAAWPWSEVDLLINNAGILRAEDTLEDFTDSFRVNAVAPFMITQALLPSLRKSKRPRALHLTSRMGSIEDNSSGGYYSYRASKAALNIITKSMSVDHPWLTTAVVHPGWVQTDMGGDGATTTVEDSARGIWALAERLEPEQSGTFFDYRGQVLPW